MSKYKLTKNESQRIGKGINENIIFNIILFIFLLVVFFKWNLIDDFFNHSFFIGDLKIKIITFVMI